MSRIWKYTLCLIGIHWFVDWRRPKDYKGTYCDYECKYCGRWAIGSWPH